MATNCITGFGWEIFSVTFGIPVSILAITFMLGHQFLFSSCADYGRCWSGCFLCGLSGLVRISPSFFGNCSMILFLITVISFIFSLSVSSHTALYERSASSFKFDFLHMTDELRCIPGQKLQLMCSFILSLQLTCTTLTIFQMLSLTI